MPVCLEHAKNRSLKPCRPSDTEGYIAFSLRVVLGASLLHTLEVAFHFRVVNHMVLISAKLTEDILLTPQFRGEDELDSSTF